MKIEKKSLCIFIHFGKQANFPKYVEIYFKELSAFFDQIIMVTNERSVETYFSGFDQNLSTLFVENEGYDLGMFYKAFQAIDPDEYYQIACINDSNILFNKLNPIFAWGKQVKFDFWGLIDSYEKPWFATHLESYHIQSHFLVFNQKAILKLPAYFNTLNIRAIFDEKDVVKLRRTVIDKWEIGLTQFLIREGLSNGSYIDSQSYSIQYQQGKHSNVGHKLYPQLIQSGFPLIKKRIITQSNWIDVFRTVTQWESMIRRYGNQDWEIEALIQELIQIRRDTNAQNSKIRKNFLKVYNLFHKKEVA